MILHEIIVCSKRSEELSPRHNGTISFWCLFVEVVVVFPLLWHLH